MATVVQPLGAVDYLEICNHFDIILLRDIPRMSLGQRSETRRFITLIDTLYDQKVRRQSICLFVTTIIIYLFSRNYYYCYSTSGKSLLTDLLRVTRHLLSGMISG